MKLNRITLLLMMIFLAAACQPKPVQPQVLTVMTHDSFAISEEVVNVFESENNVEVQFLEVGDTGTAVNKAALSKDNPLADVFYGVDNTFLSRALEEDIFEAYQSPVLDEIDQVFQLDPTFHALPVDFGDVCLNYQKSYFEENELAPPETLEDLTLPAYQDLLTVQNPATSSPGLAFLMTTIGYFGEDAYLTYWSQLVENGVEIVNDWGNGLLQRLYHGWGGRTRLWFPMARVLLLRCSFQKKHSRKRPPLPSPRQAAAFGRSNL